MFSILMNLSGLSESVIKGGSDSGTGIMPVSYTHLDVYKRQLLIPAQQEM